jgi:hypothetical protein
MIYLTDTMNHKTVVAPRKGGKLPPIPYYSRVYREPPKKKYNLNIVATFHTRTAPDLFSVHCREQAQKAREAIKTLGNPKYGWSVPFGDAVVSVVADFRELEQRHAKLCANYDKLLAAQLPVAS